MGDPCDTQAWLEMWTKPIPGSLVYVGNEPLLVGSPDRAGQLWTTLLDAAGRSTIRARKPELSSQPPKTRSFRGQLPLPGCWGLPDARHPDSIKIAKCHAKIDKRYAGPFDAAQRSKENARTLGSLEAAEAKLARLETQDDKDRDRECGPMERVVEKRWEKTFNEIVDHYSDTAYSDHLDRARQLQAEDEVMN